MSKPRVAILGASADRSKFGNKSLRAHAQAGYEAVPVNPKGGEIEGRQAVRSLAEVPRPIARISVYLPPALGLAALAEIAEAGAEEVWFNPGTESPEIRRKVDELGIPAVFGCSIVDLGLSPSQFP
jgi:predicted CoA-binding protein